MALPARAAVALGCAAVLALAGCGGGSPPAGPELPAATPSRSAPATAAPVPTSAPPDSPGPTSPGPTGPEPSSPRASSPGPTSPAATPAPPGAPCRRLAARLSLREQVGQVFMVGVDSGGLSRRDADVLADTRAGAVILLGNSTAGRSGVRRLTAAVRAAAPAPDGVRTLLTVDQEGGLVQRLQGPGFDRIPSAQVQARSSSAALADAAAGWGRQLERAGVDANLAPVADVVPRRLESVNQPIGRLRRGYGPDPEVVADRVSAFVDGMDRAGLATAVKHFPGLGRVRGNTDFASKVVDRSTTRRDGDLRGFAAGVRADVDMVMVSSAYYTEIDPRSQAAFSSTVIEQMLRGDLGFNGVVISDDLAARAVRDLSPGRRALRFLEAGGDLVIVGDPRLARSMVGAVISRARSDEAFAVRLTDHAARVLALKQRRGLADCG